MIKSIADKRTKAFISGQRVPEFQAFERQAFKRVKISNDATSINDLMRLASNHFEALHGDRAGQFGICTNTQRRICFSFEEGDSYDVEIVDYR